MQKNKFHFNNLDSIRSLAFLSTFLAHAFYAESSEVLNSESFKFAVSFREIFSFGVPVFFVLSGFLITYLMLKEQNEQKSFNLPFFYLRRFLRIWPVYFAVIIFGFILFPVIRSFIGLPDYTESASPIMYALFLSNFDQINSGILPYGAGLGPTWSVSVEEQFYLIWPLFLFLFRGKSFIYAICIFTGVSIVFSQYYDLSHKNTIYCMIYLATGGGFAYFSYFKKSFVNWIEQRSSVFFIFCVVSIFFLIYVSIHLINSIFITLLIAIAIGLVIVFQCFNSKVQLRKIPLLEKLGKYTYGMYLYHVICNFIVYNLLYRVLQIDESIFSALVIAPILSLCMTLVISVFSYRYFESYFLKLKNRFKRV